MSKKEQKLFRIAQIAKQCFTEKTNLLFLTQSVEAAEYVDKSLWAYPVHSLIPHEFTLNPSEEIICISLAPNNPNESKHVFNLTNQPLLAPSFLTIYEFDDISSKERALVSKNKYHQYKEEKFALASF